MSTFIEKALHYAELGWPLVPQDRNKKPLIKGWPELATCDLGKLEKWSKQFPDANVALATGERAGVFVIDLDSLDAQARWLEVRNLCGISAGQTMVKTRRGVHLYYRTVGRVKSVSPSPLGIGIDIRGEGALATLPPSVHSSGHVYEWVGEPDLHNLPLPNSSLINMMSGRDPHDGRKRLETVMTTRRAEEAIDHVTTVGEGGRNAALNKAAFICGKAIAAGLLTEFEAWRRLNDAAAAAGIPRPEAAATIRSGLRSGERNWSRSRTSTSNKRRG
jgi:hypothetical protein